jgi:hypothetical protein
VQVLSRYCDTTELCEGGGFEWIGSLLDTVGLPLEIIHIAHDRVFQVDAFDYEAGQAKPMTRQSMWRWEVLECPPPPQVSVEHAIMAVHPDGSWHTVVSMNEGG